MVVITTTAWRHERLKELEDLRGKGGHYWGWLCESCFDVLEQNRADLSQLITQGSKPASSLECEERGRTNCPSEGQCVACGRWPRQGSILTPVAGEWENVVDVMWQDRESLPEDVVVALDAEEALMGEPVDIRYYWKNCSTGYSRVFFPTVRLYR